MWSIFAATDPQTVLASGNILAIMALIIVTLAGVVVYLARKLDKQATDSATEIRELNKFLYSEQKAHTIDYRELSNDYRDVVQANTQTTALIGEKIEVLKGRRR